MVASLKIMKSKKIKLNALETKEYGVGIWELLHVSGFCWLETDADGIRKSDESMLDGVRIVLEGQKNNLTYETYSDAEGNWYIGQVKPGFYKMTVYVPDGMMFTKYSRVGGDNRSIFTMDGAKTGTKVMDMNDGKSVEQQNVGFMVSSFIEGRCFLDENYNGVWDEGEKPLPGVKLQAIKQIQNDVVAETVSGEDGTYSLSGLRANTYVIRAILPEGGATFTKTVATAEGNRFKAGKQSGESADRQRGSYADQCWRDLLWLCFRYGICGSGFFRRYEWKRDTRSRSGCDPSGRKRNGGRQNTDKYQGSVSF